ARAAKAALRQNLHVARSEPDVQTNADPVRSFLRRARPADHSVDLLDKFLDFVAQADVDTLARSKIITRRQLDPRNRNIDQIAGNRPPPLILFTNHLDHGLPERSAMLPVIRPIVPWIAAVFEGGLSRHGCAFSPVRATGAHSRLGRGLPKASAVGQMRR